MLEKYGERPRHYRNGLGLAVPATDQIETLRREVRYVMAIERVKAKSKLNLTDEQKADLKEKEATHRRAAESAFLKLYTEVWLPKLEDSRIGIDAVAVGGRPLQTTLDENKQARVHDRVMELLADVQRRIFTTVKAVKIVDLFKLGQGEPPTVGIRTADVVDGFYSYLGFTRLLDSVAIRKAVAEGVRDGMFGYFSGSVSLIGADGRYQVPPDRVRIGVTVSEDEIDLDTGFLMMPAAIPQPPKVSPPPAEPPIEGQRLAPEEGEMPPPPPPPPPSVEVAQKRVEVRFTADRNQLFTAWNAIANLADMAGTVAVTVHAESEAGFDKSKLNNGVLEPLKEADLIE
jgi:hypothetical protein